MNRVVKVLLGGLLIWFIPFLMSLLFWDVSIGAPSIPDYWFSAIMAVSWAIGFYLASCLWFKGSKDPFRDGLVAGLVWYCVQIVLDLLVLVFGFGMPTNEYFAMLVTYLNTFILAVLVGRIKARK